MNRPAEAEVARFAADLAPLLGPDERTGVAVSGGPDSLALLFLAAAARPGRIEAVTVDHGLRRESADEAAAVEGLCADIGVPHATLTAAWGVVPNANIQAQARDARYALLADWARSTGLTAVATAHHADDQAETLLMRLGRGAGLAGLAGARRHRRLADGIALIRPLLGWRKTELATVVADVGVPAVDDPANYDPRHDRTRMRQWLSESKWADPVRIATSAAWLGEAEAAIEWAMQPVLAERMTVDATVVTIDPAGLPDEIMRRLLLAAFARLGASPPRGPELARAMNALRHGESATLSGLLLEGGLQWHLRAAPPRR